MVIRTAARARDAFPRVPTASSPIGWVRSRSANTSARICARVRVSSARPCRWRARCSRSASIACACSAGSSALSSASPSNSGVRSTRRSFAARLGVGQLHPRPDVGGCGSDGEAPPIRPHVGVRPPPRVLPQRIHRRVGAHPRRRIGGRCGEDLVEEQILPRRRGSRGAGGSVDAVHEGEGIGRSRWLVHSIGRHGAVGQQPRIDVRRPGALRAAQRRFGDGTPVRLGEGRVVPDLGIRRPVVESDLHITHDKEGPRHRDGRIGRSLGHVGEVVRGGTVGEKSDGLAGVELTRITTVDHRQMNIVDAEPLTDAREGVAGCNDVLGEVVVGRAGRMLLGPRCRRRRPRSVASATSGLRAHRSVMSRRTRPAVQ